MTFYKIGLRAHKPLFLPPFIFSESLPGPCPPPVPSLSPSSALAPTPYLLRVSPWPLPPPLTSSESLPGPWPVVPHPLPSLSLSLAPAQCSPVPSLSLSPALPQWIPTLTFSESLPGSCPVVAVCPSQYPHLLNSTSTLSFFRHRHDLLELRVNVVITKTVAIHHHVQHEKLQTAKSWLLVKTDNHNFFFTSDDKSWHYGNFRISLLESVLLPTWFLQATMMCSGSCMTPPCLSVVTWQSLPTPGCRYVQNNR